MEEEKDILSDFKKTERPNVPSNYFTEFQKKMLDETAPEEKKKKSETTINFNMKYLYYTVGVAAAVVLVFLAVNNLDFSSSPAEEQEIVEEVQKEKKDTAEVIYEYVEANLADYNTEELIDMLAENDEIPVVEEIKLDEVPSSEVELYLIEEYDYEDLEEELIDEL